MLSAALSKMRGYELCRAGRGELVVIRRGKQWGLWPQCRPLIPSDVGDLFAKDLADVLDWDLDQNFVLEDA